MSEARQKRNSLLVAYKKAAILLKKAQPEVICRKTGAVFEKGAYNINFLSKLYEISMPEVQFITQATPTIVEVLILHYLISEEDTPVKGEFISFRGIPGGMFYFKSFQQRALDKLISILGDSPEKLISAGTALGGKKWSAGDYSVVIPVFPKIDMVAQIYKADDEFPAAANILYSDNITNFLPAEDAAFLGSYFVGAIAGTL
jgi:hypothetical protein